MDFPTIEAAKSALMARWKWDEPQAHRWLQRSAMETRLTKNAVAELVTHAGKTGRWDQLREQLGALKESRPRPPRQHRSAQASTAMNAPIAAATFDGRRLTTLTRRGSPEARSHR
jgi:hypothetical protein